MVAALALVYHDILCKFILQLKANTEKITGPNHGGRHF